MKDIPKKVRDAVEERSEKLCEFRDEMDNRCGRYDPWRGQCHHIIPRSQGGEHTEANLMWVCGFHSAKLHGLREV